MYVIGGYDGSQYFDDFWVFDATDAESSWIRLKVIPGGGRTGHTMTLEPELKILLVIGGLGGRGGDFSDTLYAYDLERSSWRRVKGAEGIAVYGHSAVFHQDHFYVFGGIDRNAAAAADDGLMTKGSGTAF
jgi:N-acetylneuraminic acid mutarotase